MGKASNEATKATDETPKPYNRYNIFYILERERHLQHTYNYDRRGDRQKKAPSPTNFTTGYEDVDLPSLPPRYEHVDLDTYWFMPGRRKAIKRNHKKSHGLASFQEIAQVVADGWKSIDETTMSYCTEVAKILKARYDELKKMGVNVGTNSAAQTAMPYSNDLMCTGSASFTHMNITEGDFSRVVPNRERHASHRSHPDAARRVSVVNDRSDDEDSIQVVDIPDAEIMNMWNRCKC